MNTIPLPFDRHFFGLVILRILSFSIKFPSSGPVVILRWRYWLVFDLMWHVLSIIGRFQQCWIIMPFMVMIGAGPT